MAATIAASTTSIQKLLVFCLLIMLFSSFEAKADYGCMHGACDDLQLYTSSAPYTVTGGLSGSCFYEVKYERYYEVCNGDTNYYYKMLSIDFFGSPTCDNDAIMKDAIKQLLAYATSNFNLPTNSANFKINVITPVCIKKETNNGVLQIISCDPAQCCVTEYLMTNPIYLGTSTSKYTSAVVCSTLTVENCSYNCTNNDLPEGPVTAFLTPACNTDCDWGSLYSRKYTIGTCEIEVFYQKRVCNLENQIRIDKILIGVNSGCTYTVNQYIIFAKGKLLKDAAIIFAPVTIANGDAVHFYNSPCWSVFGKLILPCAYTECCKTTYEVYGKTGNYPPNNQFLSCTGPWNFTNKNCNFGGDCTNNCAQTSELPENLPKMGSINETEDLEINKNIIKSLVVPNPSKDKCDITLTLENAGALKLLVFDNNGREMAELTMTNTSSKEVTFNLNTKNFSVGNYQYIITQNDKIISKGNLIIQR